MTIVKHEKPKIMSLERYLRGVCVFKCGFILNIRNPGAKMPPPPSPIRVKRSEPPVQGCIQKSGGGWGGGGVPQICSLSYPDF